MHILIISTEDIWVNGNKLSGIFQIHQAEALNSQDITANIISPSVHSLKDIFKINDYTYKIKKIKVKNTNILKYQKINFIVKSEHMYLNSWLNSGYILFSEYIKKFGLPDVIHAHNHLFAGVLAYNLSKKYSLPYLVTEHSSEYVKGTLKSKYIKNKIQQSYNNSSKNIFVSNFLRKKFHHFLELDPTLDTVVYNSLSSEFELKYDNDFKNGCNDFVFINVASLIEIKNQISLLKSFANTFANNKKVKLKIIGDGPLKNELLNLVKELNILDQIKFLGRLESNEVSLEMLNSNAFVLSSIHETFGVVVIEALASGLPVLISNCGGPEELVNEWKNGLIYKQEVIGDLDNRLSEIYENYKKFNKVNISEDAISLYGREVISNQLIRIYKNMIN